LENRGISFGFNGVVIDRVNHLLFDLTGSNSSSVSTVTGMTSYPYAGSGFINSGISNPLTFSNNTYSCVQGANCSLGLMAILH